MRLLVFFSVIMMIVATLAIPRGHYSNEYIWRMNGLTQCKMQGEPCRQDFECCGRKSLCRVFPGDEGPFSMKFRCESDGSRFYY